jgi:hypothetical protein
MSSIGIIVRRWRNKVPRLLLMLLLLLMHIIIYYVVFLFVAVVLLLVVLLPSILIVIRLSSVINFDVIQIDFLVLLVMLRGLVVFFHLLLF